MKTNPPVHPQELITPRMIGTITNLLAARSGLGFHLQQSGFLSQTDRIFVALVTITFLGFLTDAIFRFGVSWLLSRYTRWAAI